jgi:hypothetical protein
MQISQNERFQKEIKTIKDSLGKIPSEHIKKEIQNLLSELINQVRILDSHHSNIINTKTLSDSAGGTRDRILELRKKIFKTLKDLNLIEHQ